MAIRGPYTPLKRALMQGVMWCVLLAAIGAAALVDQQLTPLHSQQVGPVQTSGPLHFQLPVGWVVEPITERGAVAVVVDPSNPSPMGPRRTLVVYHRRVFALVSPVVYLQASGLLEEIFGSTGGGTQEASATTLDGSPAIQLRGQSVVQTNGATVLESDIVICCVFPNHHAVTLWLAKLGPMTGFDESLFNEVARSVRMGDQPTIGPG